MTIHIGTHVANATPMTRAEYSQYRGWELPANEDGADEGYLVEHVSISTPNHPNHKGYISWLPKAHFEKLYEQARGMTFGDALIALKLGQKVARAGWNGKNMWLSLTPGQKVPADKFWSEHNREFANSNRGYAEVQPYITMKTAQDKIVPWLASQSDMLDEDWMVVA